METTLRATDFSDKKTAMQFLSVFYRPLQAFVHHESPARFAGSEARLP
jgi:hypothetical protein